MGNKLSFVEWLEAHHPGSYDTQDFYHLINKISEYLKYKDSVETALKTIGK